jgi:hypothetical protein
MNIRKFAEFIKEEFNDTPESYIESALRLLHKKIEDMFEDQVDLEDNKEKEGNSSIMKAKSKGKGKKLTFKDLGVQRDSNEISKYSSLYDSLTLKFSDANATYNLLILIELKEGIPKDPTKDFSFEDVENCSIKFKKYERDTFTLCGPPLTKNVKIKDIDEEFLIDLKIELDEKSGGDDEKLEIETK